MDETTILTAVRQAPGETLNALSRATGLNVGNLRHKVLGMAALEQLVIRYDTCKRMHIYAPEDAPNKEALT